MQGVGDNRWVQVDILARCAVAVEISPITLNAHFRVASGTSAADELEAFAQFGAPLTDPGVKFSGDLVAPGGFGGPIADATMHLLPVSLPTEEDQDLRMDVHTPAGEVIGHIDLIRSDLSHGSEGPRVVLIDAHEIVTIETRSNLAEKTTHISTTLGQFAGRPVNIVEPVFRFLSACHAPNTVRLGRRHAWPASAVVDPLFSKLLDQQGAPRDDWEVVAGWMADLVSIQSATTQVIATPDPAGVTNQEIDVWSRCAQLLAGHEVLGAYPENQVMRLTVPEEMAIAIRSEDSFTYPVLMQVNVKDQELDLGMELHLHLQHAQITRSVVTSQGQMLEVQTQDRQLKFHLEGSAACQCVNWTADIEQ